MRDFLFYLTGAEWAFVLMIVGYDAYPRKRMIKINRHETEKEAERLGITVSYLVRRIINVYREGR